MNIVYLLSSIAIPNVYFQESNAKLSKLRLQAKAKVAKEAKEAKSGAKKTEGAEKVYIQRLKSRM